ncbi:DUF4352 domain-containing protein [Psychrobacillus glaciei]|uniref:DUF4352 domain-containing protein n=1 Tax=Psychrobacillus glaciei TaxID=2283160 RepID=A0A5J6SLL9_9BACI|nr:DUF4352 domain-containing protein [Psychrobacillus glaciei]QFF98815.1 DUF4352 domain-containing protein [Psychrobacillus glaciei]
MKKNLFFIATIITTLILVACGSEEEKSTDKEKKVETSSDVTGKTIEESDIAKLYTSPKDYKNFNYEFIGQVFTTPEKDKDGTYLQVYADPENNEYNTIVGIDDPELVVSDGDYIKVKGVVKDVFEGENMLGGTILAPMVKASSIEVTDYISAIAPTLATIEINKPIDQHGFVVTLEKIEFAKKHTRVYVSVTNNTKDKISFYTHNMKIVSGGSQFEGIYEYDTGYPEVQSDLLPGITTTGVVTFPAMDPATAELQIYAEGYSDNYDIDIEPFVFTVAK